MSALEAFAKAFSSGKIKVVDLTQTLAPDFPSISLPPDWARPGRSASRRYRATTSAAPLVLEQLLLRRAHRHALRRAHPLDLGQGPAAQRGRLDPAGTLHRAGLRDRLLEGSGAGCGLSFDREVHQGVGEKHSRIPRIPGC
jgi:hypothetical protein